jgi:hypothetical protein
METRILDLDGSVTAQGALVRASGAVVAPLRGWGPRLRLACRWGMFRRFRRELEALPAATGPWLTFLGSGDFHHVSLALLARLRTPCNLLVLDKHPDWMRGVPLLHCGTWLWHAAALPQVARVYHVGGDLDFDNRFRWLAPWSLLRSGKIHVIPAVRHFRGRRWAGVAHDALRQRPAEPADPRRVSECLGPLREELAARPLYVSLDKDVLSASEALVNWDSGHLTTGEALGVIEAFAAAAGWRLAGMDVVGDWSAVRVTGLLRRLLHWTEHPSLSVDPAEAARRNETHNLHLLRRLQLLSARRPQAAPVTRAA